MEDEQRNKAHKSKVVGNKATKRDELRKKKAGIDLEPNRGASAKAFQGPAAGSHKTHQFLRSVEKRESALHAPEMDHTLRHLVAEPPLLVAVVGPPGVGKTTLIRSMVKFYGSRTLHSVRGPITVVAGRSRRITFLECPNTLTAMCDVAKVADLVLLMVDGSFGFEMETFEFLNIAQVHGFPKIFGVVSHLDQLKNGKSLKKQKKFLRHRFWHEVAAGAKLICLAPMIRGSYRPTDVLNLHRLLICVEPKVQAWRNTHSCVLIDRQEDITSPELVVEQPNCNRTIAFYGYARGKPMRPNQTMHVAGLGDFTVSHLSHLADPCLVDKPSEGKSQGHRMRHLTMKQKKIYAPYCDVGGLTYDDDAIYVQEDAEKAMIERSGEGVELLRELQRTEPMDAAKTNIRVVRRPVNFVNEDTMELDMHDVRMPSDNDDGTDGEADELYSEYGEDGPVPALELADFGAADSGHQPPALADEPAEDESLAPRTRNAADSVRVNRIEHDWTDAGLLRALKDLCVTGNWRSGEDDEESAEGLGGGDEDKGYESEDSEFEAIAQGVQPLSKPPASDNGEDTDDIKDQLNEDEAAEVRGGLSSSSGKLNALASVNYGSAGAHATGRGARGTRNSNAYRDEGDADDDGFDILASDEKDGDGGEGSGAAEADTELDQLVAGFLGGPRGAAPAAAAGNNKVQKSEYGIEFYDAKEHMQRRANVGEDEDDLKESSAVVAGGALSAEQERMMQKKMDKKRAFDDEYDAGGSTKNMTYSHYNKLTRAIDEKKERLDNAIGDLGDDLEKKIHLAGYFSGLYVRFVLKDVPVEFLRCFNPSVPLIAGGIAAGEDRYQIVHAKIKRHRWYPKVLKAQDPLLLSIGWRRLQTQPIFAVEDPNGRCRYLKYTPLHMHCLAAFYAPAMPTNTGFLAIPVREQRTSNFRLSCTGYTTGNDVSTSFVKKLKLTGTPAKVDKTTAFITGMFTSDIEAAKFVGAKLKSVSGIRGIIKAVLKGKNGLVRATFEDKIFLSDIVFIRAWRPVNPPRYCSIQRNLLDPNWVGMRTMRELRWEHGIPLTTSADSEYREIKRRHRVADEGEDFNAQRVLLSRNKKMQLPFDMKEEFIPLDKPSALQERIQGATTVAPEPRELRRQALLDTFEDRADAMTQKKDEAKKRARERAAKLAAKENEKYVLGLKKAKKETARRSEFRSQHKSRHD